MAGEIVVGIDGSEPAASALRWAVAEAKLRHCRLRVIHGYQTPLVTMDMTGEALSAMEEASRQILADVVGGLRAEAPELEVETSSCPAGGAEALVEASQGAELVVVGNRGRGGFAGVLLGSVSTQVVHHAACPVVVVRS